ncbi:hypothetical protein HMPREF0281_01807 [Corynebacterium ammoniagenes DSM 20306]|uniref:Uncharacterized protein n=1 Tax=Corynebacterium ammoniagenes DSM 20306 TaxID=649754 RepID=A0ABN0ADW1_CORAM|nr:hypothetical protein HMPREF0281_01807 [Corynebacterium ammoniagenes DSM 20306]
MNSGQFGQAGVKSCTHFTSLRAGFSWYREFGKSRPILVMKGSENLL